jgi:hypothetical protein
MPAQADSIDPCLEAHQRAFSHVQFAILHCKAIAAVMRAQNAHSAHLRLPN